MANLLTDESLTLKQQDYVRTYFKKDQKNTYPITQALSWFMTVGVAAANAYVHVGGNAVSEAFAAFLFWTTVTYIGIATIGAVLTVGILNFSLSVWKDYCEDKEEDRRFFAHKMGRSYFGLYCASPLARYGSLAANVLIIAALAFAGYTWLPLILLLGVGGSQMSITRAREFIGVYVRSLKDEDVDHIFKEDVANNLKVLTQALKRVKPSA
ncbi:MAG: hypothetical protein HC888_02585 [Candidatus Competibacteraceae bacterium]|nr:hypothetical protein [Candidatus Competibacteraceae bacterium]